MLDSLPLLHTFSPHAQVKALLDGALHCALDALRTNQATHAGLSQELLIKERMEGAVLQGWLGDVKVCALLCCCQTS